MGKPEYAIITGNGRSGTNWLERMLDASPLTHCRSEPYGIPSSPFNQVPQVWKVGAAAPDIGLHWDNIILWSRSHIGERDHGFRYPKQYVYPFVQRTGIAMLMAHSKTRRLFGLVQPSLRKGEWPLPWWVGNQRRLKEAYATFKINLDQRTAAWILENRQQARILHIVRHPCGRLNSWLKRFVSNRDGEQLLTVRRERLRKIAEVEPAWRNRFGDIDVMNLLESEVWFWRYVNESIYSIGRNYPAYLRVVYEELAQDPLVNAREVYKFCGLPWDSYVEAIISEELRESDGGKTSNTPAAIARSWKTTLSPEHVRTVEKIVRDSSIMTWWREG